MRLTALHPHIWPIISRFPLWQDATGFWPQGGAMRCRQQWVENLEARQLFAGLSTEVVLGGSGSLTVNASKALTDGSYVIAGTFSGKIDFQPKGGSEIDAVASDGFIASYSVRDKLLWVDTFVGEGTQSINA